VDLGAGVSHIIDTDACQVTIFTMKFGGHQNQTVSVCGWDVADVAEKLRADKFGHGKSATFCPCFNWPHPSVQLNFSLIESFQHATIPAHRYLE